MQRSLIGLHSAQWPASLLIPRSQFARPRGWARAWLPSFFYELMGNRHEIKKAKTQASSFKQFLPKPQSSVPFRSPFSSLNAFSATPSVFLLHSSTHISDSPQKKIKNTHFGDPLFHVQEHVSYQKPLGAKKSHGRILKKSCFFKKWWFLSDFY